MRAEGYAVNGTSNQAKGACSIHRADASSGLLFWGPAPFAAPSKLLLYCVDETEHDQALVAVDQRVVYRGNTWWPS